MGSLKGKQVDRALRTGRLARVGLEKLDQSCGKAFVGGVAILLINSQ